MDALRNGRAIVAAVLVAATFLVGQAAVPGRAATGPFAGLTASTTGVHLGLYFDNNLNVAQKTAETGNIDLVSGSQSYPAPFQDLPEAGTVHTWGMQWGRDGSLSSGAFKWFETNHPDWISYACNRTVPAWYPGDIGIHVPLDFTNAAVQQYEIQTQVTPAIEGGYQGITLDQGQSQNVWSHQCGVYQTAGQTTDAVPAGASDLASTVSIPVGTSIAVGDGSDMEFTTVISVTGSGPFDLAVTAPLANAHVAGEWIGQWKQQYSGATLDHAYRAAQAQAFQAFVVAVKSLYPNAVIGINSIFLPQTGGTDQSGASASDYWGDFPDAADLVVDECGFTNCGATPAYLTTAPSSGGWSNPWLTEMEDLIHLEQQGKALLLVNYSPYRVTSNMTLTSSKARFDAQWVMANYLLVRGSYTYLTWHAEQFIGGEIYQQPEFKAPIGGPVGGMFQSDNVWMRQYTNGLAAVNPSATTSATLSLPTGEYVDLYGSPVTTYVMPPHSGLVLLFASGANGVWDDVASEPNPPTFVGAATAPCFTATGLSCLYRVGGIIAGSPTNSVDMFDPSMSSWTPAAALGQARAGAATSNAPCPRNPAASCIYVAGGEVVNAQSQTVATDTVEVFDPLQAAWTSMPPLPNPRIGAAAATAQCTDAPSSQCLYVVGGTDGFTASSEVDEFNPSTETWATSTALPNRAAYSGVASAPCVADGGSTCLYAAGGDAGSGSAPSSSMEMFDPSANTWTEEAELPYGADGLALVNGPCDPATSTTCLYAVGGSLDSVSPGTGGALPVDSVEQFDPATNSWSAVASLRHSASVVAGASGPCVAGSSVIRSTSCLYALSDHGSGVYVSDPPVLTITAQDESSVYGANSLPALSYSVTDSDGSDKSSSLAVNPVCFTPVVASTGAVTGSRIGSYPITCSNASAPGYRVRYVGGTFDVLPAPLLISTPSLGINYGRPVPAVTPIYTGLTNRDSSLFTSASCSTSAGVTGSIPAAGSYAINCSGAGDANYQISYQPSVFTVSPAPLTIQAASVTTTYGRLFPPLTVSYSGFVNHERAGALTTQPTCSTVAAPTSAVGLYSISCAGAVDPNYQIRYAGGTLRVNPAPLSITPSGVTLAYGQLIPAIRPVFAGFVNHEGPAALSSGPSCGSAAGSVGSPSPAVGLYAEFCWGAADLDYLITYKTGTLSVKPAALTVTPASVTTAFGSVMPTLSWSANFVNGDTSAVLNQLPQCSTSAQVNANGQVSSARGSYPITCTGASSPNYTIAYGRGTLSVAAAETVIEYAGSTMLTFGAPAQLSATLRTSSGMPVGGKPLSFTLSAGAGRQSCSSVTNGTGMASCLLSAVSLPRGSAVVTVQFAGDSGSTIQCLATKLVFAVNIS